MDAVQNNKTSIDVFGHNNRVESIQQKDFEKTVKFALDEFCRIEDYESAAACKKLLDKLTVHKLIDSTKSM